MALLLLGAQVAASIADGSGSALLHLTNWAAVANIAYHALCLLSIHLGTPTVPAVFHLFVLQQSVFVAGGMTALSIQDDAVMLDVEARLGAFVGGAGNWVFHYLPPLASWLLMVTWPDTFLAWYAHQPWHIITLASAGTPLYFALCYSSLYNPHTQYAGDFSARAVFGAGACCVLLVHIAILSIVRVLRGMG